MQELSVLGPLIASTPVLVALTGAAFLLKQGLIVTLALVAVFSDEHGPAAERVLKQLIGRPRRPRAGT